jgi:prolyl 4-hydroxylase
MGAKFPEYALAQAANMNIIDYKALVEIPLLRLGKRRDVNYIANPKIQLLPIDRFLSSKECAEVIKLMEESLRPSTVTVSNGDDTFRTSYSSDLSLLKSEFVNYVDKKIADALGINISYSEGVQGQKYNVGEEFKPHTDYFEPATQDYKDNASVRGNRTWTFMIYLQNTPKGGATYFPRIDKIFYPKKGMAVVWNNLYGNGAPNADTLHHGMKVEKGKKYIITKWFREKGNGPMFVP